MIPKSAGISPPGGKPRFNCRPRSLWLLLTVMVAASAGIRVLAYLYWGTGTIESEGAEYAKIAENLRNGVGYVGLVLPGPQVHFPPLFPFLIAGASFLTNDYELAGRLVALILGSLLPLPVFGIASRLFNRPVGIIAGMLTLLYPLSVYLSFMVLSEGPYATLILTAVYLVVRTLNGSTVRSWALIGGAFGICYLLRAEALAPFAISVLFAFFATCGSRIFRFRLAASAIVVFLLVALPEIIFIHGATGRVEFETKSTNLLFMAKRVLAAESAPGVDFVSSSGLHDVPSPTPDDPGDVFPWEVQWAYYGIDSQLNETGAAMRSWVDIATEEHVKPKEVFRILLSGVGRNIAVMFNYFSSGWLGAPLLAGLALLGVFRRPWHRPRASVRFYVALVAAAPIASTFVVLWYADPRYYFIFVPFLCIWAANGLYGIGLWIRASCKAAGWNILVRYRFVQWIIPGLLGLAIVTSPIKKVRALYEFADSAPPFSVDKAVGLWIGSQQSRPIRVMDLSLPLSFHAGAQQQLYFPYCTEDLALRYLNKVRPDFIVLRHGEKYTRYYEEWLANGIPDQQVELVRLPPLAGSEKFVIYRWHPAGS